MYVLDEINKEIEYHTGGDELKSWNESIRDDYLISILKKIKLKILKHKKNELRRNY